MLARINMDIEPERMDSLLTTAHFPITTKTPLLNINEKQFV